MNNYTPLTMPDIDLSALKNEVNDVVEKHTNAIISQIITACNVFKESHDHMCNLPIVKQVYSENVELNEKITIERTNLESLKSTHINYINETRGEIEKLVQENVLFKEKLEKLSQTSNMISLQQAISDRN
ncbi:hypothetical protein N8261_05990, partial [Flavobacteriaceae bacterium]|nr:hypothetical protein [Flavobacteriaceae bacterium]